MTIPMSLSDTSSMSSRSSITLLLGGVRAGKSARALALAESLVEPKTGRQTGRPDADLLWFVATAQASTMRWFVVSRHIGPSARNDGTPSRNRSRSSQHWRLRWQARQNLHVQS